MEKTEVGEVIKRLRRAKNVTQEQLANFIGVSTPAVSKWESGISYPDISILPVLANYFSVTIDELLNYRSELNESEIIDIINECQNLFSTESIENAIELCEKYIKKYYSDYRLKLKLIDVYTLSCMNLTDISKREKVVKRAIEILEDIVGNTKDIEIKELALAQLSTQYMFINNLDKAEEALKKIYKPSINPSVMLPLIYMEGGKIEQAKKIMQENLNNALNEAIISSLSLSIAYYNYKPDMKKEEIDFVKANKYYELALEISNGVYEGRMNYSIYYNLAHLSIKQGKLDKCLDFIRKMINSIQEKDIVINSIWCFDSLDDLKLDIESNIFESTKKALETIKEEFDILQVNEEFKSILENIRILCN